MIGYNNSAPKAVNNVGQFGATEGSIGAYKSAAEYAADAKYWALLSQTKHSSLEDILAEVERLYAQGLLMESDIEQLKNDFEEQNQALLGLIQSTGTAIDNANAATELSKEATQEVLAQLDIISNMTVQTTLLSPGSMATGSYDNTTGVFSFGIPEGQPGRDGTDGSISDISDVAIGVPVSDDYGFYVDKENGGLYRANMSDIANLIPSIRSISINGGEEQTGAVSFNSVSSFNSRTGDVVSEVGDYSVEQITGAAASGDNSDITSLSGLTTALSVSQGGTGATTPEDSRTNLGLGSVSVEDIVPLVKGGTGATTPSAARTNLGLGLVSTESIVPITKGGTGSTSAENARLALVAAKSGANSDITSMTNSVTFTQPVTVPDAAVASNAVNLGQISSDNGASLIGTLGGTSVQDSINEIDADLIELKLNWAVDNGYSDIGFTFATGGTLTVDDSDKVVYDPVSREWYSYTGTLPVTVPTKFNPVDNVDWKPQTDPLLREELSSASGASMVGLSVSGTVADAIKYFTPEMFGAAAVYDNSVDDCGFVQAAIDAAESSGGSSVVLLSRQYKLISAPQTFTTPGDDGTVYPGWVGSGDENMAAQTRYTQQFHLKMHSGTRLVGLNKECGFKGTWSYASGPIDIGQPGMLLITTDNPYYGILTNQISGMTCTDFFTGIIVEGTIFQSEYKDLKFKYVGFPFIAHGCENSSIKTVDCGDCWTGIIVGGWWTTRNRIAGRDGSGTYVPPYDGTGAALLGWCDGLDVYDISYSVAVRPWGDRHVNIDTYFNKYFYNRAYSALTSGGGRASNNTNPSDTAVYPTFYGVASRALTVLSRNGRNNSNTNVRKLRTNGTHRPPLFVNRSNLCTVTDAHVERSGWVDASAHNQIFGVDVKDPYRSAGYVQSLMSEGFITTGKDYHTPASVNSKPLTDTTWTNYRYSATLDPAADYRGAASYPEKQVWTQRGEGTYEKILSRIVNKTLSSSTDVYLQHMDYYRMPAPYIGSNAFTLQHSQGTFTPVLYVGATVVPATSASGFYERIGDTIRCTINWYNSSVDITSLSGQVSIQGMPMTLTAHSGSNFPAVVVGYLTAPNTYGITGSMSGTTLSLRKQNHTALLTASDFTAGTVAHFVQLTVEYTVASVAP